MCHCPKSVRIRSYSDPYFPAFGLNTERYSLSPRIQSECGKIRTRITPNTILFTECVWERQSEVPEGVVIKYLWVRGKKIIKNFVNSSHLHCTKKKCFIKDFLCKSDQTQIYSDRILTNFHQFSKIWRLLFAFNIVLAKFNQSSRHLPAQS